MKTNEDRKREADSVVRGIVKATHTAAPDDRQAWEDVAKRAGQLQRRARLLAGKTRGG